MDQIYRIRHLRKFEGKSLRNIAKITGHDFETVKKYAEKDNFNLEPKTKQQRQGKLAPYEDIVREWLRKDIDAPHKQRHTAKRVYDRLREQYPEFDSSDRSVRTLVAKLKEELDLQKEGFLPLEHPAGEAQVDFGSATFIENGVEFEGNYLNISFPFSNGGYTQLFKAENQECLLEGLKAIFEHIEGVPTAIWFDNMSTAVKKIRTHGERDLREYNKELLNKLDKDMDRKHYIKNALIKDLFLEDKEEYSKLPEVPFEVSKYEFAKADNYGKVKFDAKIYSSSPNMAKKQVMIKVGAYDVEILDDDSNLIVRHDRLYGDQKESMIWIPYLELMAKRPTALKYTGFFNELPTTLKTFLESCDYECKKKTLKTFVDMTIDSSIDKAIDAFEEGIKCGARDADGIWATYSRLNSGSLPEVDIILPSTVPTLREYSPNINEYDQLITRGGLQQ